AAAAGDPLPGIDIIHINNDPRGPLQRMRVPTANLGKSEDAGYDLNAEYRIRAAGNRIAFNSDYSRKLYSKTVAFPGADQVNVLGERGHPSWRFVNSASLTAGSQGFMLRNNVLSKQNKTPTKDSIGTLGSYSTYDAQYTWNHPWNGSIAFGALNLLNKDFPKDDTEREGDDQRVKELFTADGRLFYVNLNQSF
ncbi:MAG: TonB-dependent receptor, partial [Proteobacteria bacterium]|nr:TonB-dependent receptor [Pseudomonadota bacterium]